MDIGVILRFSEYIVTNRIDKIRRFLLTVLLYLAFGFVSVVLCLFVLGPVVLMCRKSDKRTYVVRKLNRMAFSMFVYSGDLLGIFTVTIFNDHELNRPGQLIVANHPSLLDVVFLLSRVPNANCIVKKNLLKNPFLAAYVYFAEYILNHDGERLIERCSESLNRGETVVLFPEGTRTKYDNRLKFKRIAARLILAVGCPVTLVHITCSPPAMKKQMPWYAIPEHKIEYRITVVGQLEGCAANEISGSDSLNARYLTRWLTGWYNEIDSTMGKPVVQRFTVAGILSDCTPHCTL